MLLNEVINQMQEINKYVLKCKWLDFEFVNISCGAIKIIGSIDLSWKDYQSIEIEFNDAEYISAMLYGFGLQKERPFIELEDKSTVEHERGFLLAEDDYCFKINIEDFNGSPIRIIAKRINCKILKCPN